MTETIPAWVDGELVAVDKLEVHRRGLWHPAVSVFLMAGTRTLIQQRAAGKYHSPRLWANACCTHPRVGEAVHACAVRRVRDELGVEGVVLDHRGGVDYAARVDPGMTERERVQLFVGALDPVAPLRPDPGEVAATRWIELAALRAEVSAEPGIFTPWLRIYLAGPAARLLGDA